MRLSSFVHILPVLGFVLSVPVDVGKRDNVTLAAPIIMAPSQHWEGVDGTWSTFAIRVGTPPRLIRVLPATSMGETWVVYNGSACNATSGVPSDCAESRGGTFDGSGSTTWTDLGNFELDLNQHLGYGGLGNTGYDTVGTGYDNNTGIVKARQIVTQMVTDQFWFGFFGVGFQPSNLSDFGNPIPTFAETLHAEGLISSPSWSYTAGAYYKLKSVFGSLILGGYDTSRFKRNDVTFTMTGDNLRDLVVTVRSIKSTTNGQDTSLMSTPEFIFIDSTVPELWLPISVCQQFENAFGLKYDEETSRYLLDQATHNSLTSRNPSITVTLANQKEGGPTVDIVLPYAAFDQNLSTPLYNGTTNYFPLRRAENENMYTLGRTFLQEAYVTTNYNTRTFNVSQTLFPDPPSPNVVAIPPFVPGSTGTGGNGTTKDPEAGGSAALSNGAIAGIVVAAVLAGLLLVTLIFFCCPCGFCPALTLCGVAGGRARHTSRKSSDTVPPPKAVEIDGKRVGDSDATAYTTQASGLTSEVPGHDAKVEIAGNPIMHPQEMEAEIPESVLAAYQRDRAGYGSEDNYRDPNISSEETRAYHSEESTGVSSMSRESPETRAARMAELHGIGTRPLNGPPDRLGRVEEVVSPVSPSFSGVFGGRHPRHNNDVDVVSSPTDTATTWSPKTPLKKRWQDEDDSNT